MKVHALSVYMRRKESVDSQIRGSVIPSFRECYGRSVCIYIDWRGQASRCLSFSRGNARAFTQG